MGYSHWSSLSSAKRTVVDDARRRRGGAAHYATVPDSASAAQSLSTGEGGEACFRQTSRC